MSFRQIFTLAVFGIMIAGCAANMNVNDKVIATVGDKKITYGEFQKEYAQNNFANSDSSDSLKNKEKFLSLLVDYDLKLLDAEKEHVADDPAVKVEMQGYEGQLAVSYVLEHEFTDPMVEKIYERQKYEVRADQVFVRFIPDSAHPAGDTLKAYNAAVDVIKDLNAGAPIDSLIKIYQGGDTYYVTAGSVLQYPGGEQFEDMLYSLNPGEVGQTAIRTPYGYVVVKLIEKRPRVESVRASHILISIEGKNPADTLKAYNKAIAVMDSIKNGVDFAKLAEDNSVDKYSAAKGGDLGYFSRGMMVREFDEAAFNMNVGQVAGPVRTRFGYHIIKLTAIKPLPSFADAKDKIRENYLKGGYKIGLAHFIDGVEAESNYKKDENTIKFLYDKVDTAKQFEKLDFDSLLTPEEKQKVAFTFDKSSESIDTVLSFEESDESFKPMLANWSNINSLVDEAAKQMILTDYSLSKAQTYAEFDSLIKEYENGILLYHIEQQMVWDKVAATDSALKPYYIKNVDKYYWPKRVDLSEIQVGSDSLAEFIYDSLKNGGDFDSLATKYTMRPDMAKQDGHWGLFADSANALATMAMTMKEGEISKPAKFESGYSIIRVNKFVPQQPKTFEEARGEVSSDYQDSESKEIQSEWLEKLKEEFGVSIDDKTFHELLAKS
ncbi:MAG: peptidylprolyl isomerase [Candidatus Kryptoniota bacterium]